MAYEPDPEFQKLFEIYTANETSIGARLNKHLGKLSSNDPLLVVTGSDMVIFPGGGRPALIESFRLSTRGFIELTAISHLGVAVPYLVRLKELGFPGWREEARRLMDQLGKVKAVNTLAYWRDKVAVAAWRGLEQKITDLVDYSCDVTLDFLERGLSEDVVGLRFNEPARLSFPFMRQHFLDCDDPDELPVSMNDMMAATFALVFLDTGHRVIDWLGRQNINWRRMMVVISGRAGRPTAALTWQTNSMCHLLWKASGEVLSPDRLYIAPHAPALELSQLTTPENSALVEAQFRQIWFSTRATVEMGRLMFEGYPAFQAATDAAPVVDPDTSVLTELPRVRSADDRRAIITRLRFVMEDPGQQLANAGAQFIVDQLCANGNRPEQVVVPGFSNVTYPTRTAAPQEVSP